LFFTYLNQDYNTFNCKLVIKASIVYLQGLVWGSLSWRWQLTVKKLFSSPFFCRGASRWITSSGKFLLFSVALCVCECVCVSVYVWVCVCVTMHIIAPPQRRKPDYISILFSYLLCMQQQQQHCFANRCNTFFGEKGKKIHHSRESNLFQLCLSRFVRLAFTYSSRFFSAIEVGILFGECE